MKFALSAFIVCDLLIQSKLADFFGGPTLKTGCLAVEFALVSLFFATSASMALKGEGQGSYIISLLMLIVTAIGLYVFHVFSGTAFNINAIGQFLPLFIGAGFVAQRKNLGFLLAFSFYASLTYVIVYILTVSLVPIDETNPLRLNDYERGERAFLAQVYVAYCLYYATSSFMKTRKSVFLVAAGLCILSFYLAQSRLISLVVLLVFVAQLIQVSRRSVGLAIFICMSLVYLVNFYGLLDSEFNVYHLFNDDVTLSIRYYEYFAAIDMIWRSPVFGMGLPASFEDFELIWSSNFYANSDVGIVGIWVGFGVVGVILFLLISSMMCIGHFQLDEDEDDIDFLRYTFFTIALYNLISPMFYGTAQIFVSMAIAYLSIYPSDKLEDEGESRKPLSKFVS